MLGTNVLGLYISYCTNTDLTKETTNAFDIAFLLLKSPALEKVMLICVCVSVQNFPVECPVCGVPVHELHINKHLDSCLTSDEKKDSLRR